MGTPQQPQHEITPRLAAVFLFLCTAMSIAAALLTNPESPFGLSMSVRNELVTITLQASPFVFVCASILVFRRHRFGYGMGLAAGLIALPWFVLTELSLAPWNSWIFLNYEDPMPSEGGGYLTFVKLKILSAALVVIATAVSSLRLFPARRTWPAFAVSFLILSVWFVHSVTPYSVPGYDHSVGAEFRILHVRKQGPWFHETLVLGQKNGRVFIWREDRHLFQYRFAGRAAMTVLGQVSPTEFERARNFAQSPGLWKLRTAPPKALRSWNAEGWYLVLKDSRLLAFTSEDGTTPPEEVTGLFNELQKLPALDERPFARRDVCLGFCYDPVAALGFSVLQQRIRLLSSSASGER
jgi:hypothetical protein